MKMPLSLSYQEIANTRRKITLHVTFYHCELEKAMNINVAFYATNIF